MEKLNAIVVEGKVYEAIKGKCSECAFYGKSNKYAPICALRDELLCAFRYSQSLTDKLNGK